MALAHVLNAIIKGFSLQLPLIVRKQSQTVQPQMRCSATKYIGSLQYTETNSVYFQSRPFSQWRLLLNEIKMFSEGAIFSFNSSVLWYGKSINVLWYGNSKRLSNGYNLDVLRQFACLVLNSITVYSYGFLLNSTMVGQASDSLSALT